jgi:hypothetical protein
VDEAVENGVGDGRIAEVSLSLMDGQLAGDQSRAAIVAIVKDFEQIASVGGGHGGESPVIKDEQLAFSDFAHQRWTTSVSACERDFFQQSRQALIKNRMTDSAGVCRQSPLTGRLQTLWRISFGEPYQSHDTAEALLGMSPRGENVFRQGGAVRAGFRRPIHQSLRGQLGIRTRTMAFGHMFIQGGMSVLLVGA